MSRQLFEEAKKVLQGEAAVKLDPVGQEDKDVDNDGDSDKTDSYLKKRRGAISAAIAKSKNESTELSEEDAQRVSNILKGAAKGLSKRDHKDVAAIRAAIGKLQAQLNQPNVDKAAIQQSIAHETKRLALYGQGVAEEAEQVVESDDLGPLKKKPKTVMLVHKTSGREKVIIDTPENRKRHAEMGFLPMKKESSEQIDEMDKSQPSSSRGSVGLPVGKKADPIKREKVESDSLKVLQKQYKKVKEETDQDYDLIEKLQVNISDTPSYQDYINAALKIAECKSFSELSEEDQQYIIGELEEAFKNNDVTFILESEALADMNDTVQRLRKAGHKVEDMGRDFKGNPFYVYIDKSSSMRRKVTYKGNQKMTQNMGRVQPEKEEGEETSSQSK
jgi:hypothetical protein